MLQSILSEFKSYLWDSKFEDLDITVNKKYIIGRVLENGTLEDVKKIMDIYPKEDIINTVKTSTEISKKTGNFFKGFYNIKDTIISLNIQSVNLQDELWRY